MKSEADHFNSKIRKVEDRIWNKHKTRQDLLNKQLNVLIRNEMDDKTKKMDEKTFDGEYKKLKMSSSSTIQDIGIMNPRS